MTFNYEIDAYYPTNREKALAALRQAAECPQPLLRQEASHLHAAAATFALLSIADAVQNQPPIEETP